MDYVPDLAALNEYLNDTTYVQELEDGTRTDLLATPPPEEQINWTNSRAGPVSSLLAASPPPGEQVDWRSVSYDAYPSIPAREAVIDPILLETPTELNLRTDDQFAPPTFAISPVPPSASLNNQYSALENLGSNYPDPEISEISTAYYEPSSLAQNGQDESGYEYSYPDPEASDTRAPYYGASSLAQNGHDTIEYGYSSPDSFALISEQHLDVPLTYSNDAPKKTTKTTEPTYNHSCRVLAPLRGGQRSKKINGFNSSMFYTPLPVIPQSWGGPEINGEARFQYDEFGELNTARRFTPEEIQEYLYNNPRRPVLWVQTTPADSSRRYPSRQSDKCRFIGCPVKNNTIHKGSFRVAFDEFSNSQLPLDPFHCAGFVHLYCMERFLNFPQICKDLRVEPDNRNLPEGKNKMAVTRDHSELYSMVNEFKRNSKSAAVFDYSETLCSILTGVHLELEPDVRGKTRHARAGNHIGLHKGDLEKFASFEKVKPRQKSGKRKNRYADEDDLFEEAKELLDFEDEEASNLRRSKRLRLSS